ncbi:MAG: MCE family protein [Acidimicrobiales bacterium]
MKAFTERRPKVIGAVAIVVMAAVVLAVIMLNRSVFRSGYPVAARFTNAAGISKGTEVLLAGVKVGTVDSVTIDGNATDATMTIDNGVVLPRHTAADIQVQTLLGVLDVTLDPARGWDRPLKAGAFLTDTSVPTELYQLNNIAGHLLERSNAKALNDLVESLATITKDKQQQVAEIIQGLGKLTSTVSNRSAEVSQLIDSSNQLAGVLARHDQQLATAITGLNTVASGLASHSTDLANLIDNLDAMASQTNGLLSQDRPQLDSLVKNLTATLGVVGKHQDDLAQAVSYLGAAVKGFSSIGFSGSTPLTWTNIYISTTGTTGTAGVFGACGAFTQVLDVSLGPTPLPCATRTATGHPTSRASSSPQAIQGTAGQGGGAVPRGAPGTASPGGNAQVQGPSNGLGGLSQLFAPLTGRHG